MSLVEEFFALDCQGNKGTNMLQAFKVKVLIYIVETSTTMMMMMRTSELFLALETEVGGVLF